MQARELCADALGEIGVGNGNVDAMDEGDADLALRYLRAMVDVFQADGYLLYAVTWWPFVLTANQPTRTVGNGGQLDIHQIRPFWIPMAAIIPVGDTEEIPLDVWSRDRWLKEPLKTLTDLYPHAINYEPSTPTLGTLTTWPIPTTAPTIKLAIPNPLVAPVDLDTDLAFAPGGYEEAWRLNLAKRLRRPFKRPVNADLDTDAAAALAVIRRAYDPGPPEAPSDPAIAGRGGFDIRANRYRS